MFKLIKYELRKNRALLLSLLAATIAIEAYFLIAVHTKADEHVVISMVLMPIMTAVVATMVFVLGVTSYSRELSQKSSYLIFMTPHSTLAIIASKLLFTLLLGIIAAVILGGLFILDLPLFLQYFDDTIRQWEGIGSMIDRLLEQSGTSLFSLLLMVLFYALTMFTSLISTVSVAYLSITLSFTLLQNRKGRSLVAVLIFIGLTYLLAKLSGLWFDSENLMEIENAQELLRISIPDFIQSAVVLVICLMGCSYLLDRYVSL